MGVEIGINWMRGPSVCPFIVPATRKGERFHSKRCCARRELKQIAFGERKGIMELSAPSRSLCVFVFPLVTEVLAESTEKQLSWKETNSESELFRMDGICEKFVHLYSSSFQLAADDNSNESMPSNLWNTQKACWKKLYLTGWDVTNVMLMIYYNNQRVISDLR